MATQQKYIDKLKDRKVLVIGGSSGIGYAVAEAAVEYGATVVVSSSRLERVEDTVKKLKAAYPSAAITGVACDLSDQANAEAHIESLFKQVGKLDHVVITAGDALSMLPIQAVTTAEILRAGQLRFFAPLLIAKHAGHYIAKSPKSSITFTGGVVSDRPIPGWPLVSGFAAGIEGVARALAVDLKPIRLNVVRPGVVDTGLYAASGIPDQMKEGLFAETASKLPVGQVGTPENLAEAYLYLMRDEFVTGGIVDSNGGQFLV